MLKNISRRPHILRMSVVLLILLGMLSAFTVFKPVLWTESPPEIDVSMIGTKTEPTTDAELLRQVIGKIDQIKIKYGTGWFHWVTASYQRPNDPNDPLFSKDGYHTKEFWYHINNAGILEKSLITTADAQGKTLQQSACGGSICGNAALIGLDEFKNTPLAIPFAPAPFQFNSALSLLAEINSTDTDVKGWIEDDGNSQILYLSTYHDNRNNQTIQSLSPEFEGTQVVIGIDVISGALQYFSLSEKIGGQFSLHMEDRTTLLEMVDPNPAVDARINEITEAIIERDRKVSANE